VIGNSFIQTPMGNFGIPDSLASLISAKLLCSVDSFRISGHGPVQDMIRLFLNTSQIIYGRKVVILQMGIGHFINDIRWNDIAVLDKQMELLVGKKIVNEFYPGSETVTIDESKDRKAKLWNKFANGKSFQIGVDSVKV